MLLAILLQEDDEFMASLITPAVSWFRFATGSKLDILPFPGFIIVGLFLSILTSSLEEKGVLCPAV